MNRATWVTALGLLGFLFACQQTPFPDGTLTPATEQKPNSGPNYILQFTEPMGFKESVKSTYVIQGTVPKPGKPVIAIFDLPQGAIYSPTTNQVSWTPSSGSGKDPNDPNAAFRSYPITIALQSSLDSVTTIQKAATFVVHATAAWAEEP